MRILIALSKSRYSRTQEALREVDLITGGSWGRAAEFRAGVELVIWERLGGNC